MKFTTKSVNAATLLALVFAPALLSVSVMQTAGAAVLEEVVVTARKREESLQDVPISVQAINGRDIAEQGLVDIQQLAPYTPGFSYTAAPGASDLYFIRGMGTFGSGVHFEPSVGQVFNGFFSTRSRLGRSALVDVAQVEVLKGPQGAIIGKNTSLGAINISSNKPTDELDMGISSQYNFEASEGYEVEGFVSGPLSDRIRARAVVNYRDVDGWVDNLSDAPQVPVTISDATRSEDFTGRVLVDIDLTDTFSAELMYQRTDFERFSKGRVVLGCQAIPGTPFSVAGTRPGPGGTRIDVGFDCNGLDATNITQLITRDAPADAPADNGEPFSQEVDMYGMTLIKDFGDATLTSLTSFTTYDIHDNFSGGQTNTERVDIGNEEDYEQIYQEFRLASNTGAFGGALDYTFGAMFFAGRLEFEQAFSTIPGAIGGPVIPVGPFAGQPNPAISRNEFASSETDSQAVFGQLDYHFNDQFTLTFGARITHETRDGRKSQIVGEAYTNDLSNAPVPCDTPGVPLAACTNGNDGVSPGGSPITGDIGETNISWNTSVQYHFDDANTFYFTAATGFKSAGFDLRGDGNPAKFVFPNEETINFEVGGKHELLGGALRANWAFFYSEVDDLQVSANDPIIIQQIVAAADVESKGVELDVQWAATDRLLLTFTGAWVDAEYDEFVGSCYLGQPEFEASLPADQRECFGLTGGPLLGQPGPTTSGVQDLSGKTPVLSPEFSFVAGARYTYPLAGNMELSASGKWIYIDDQFLSIERDPFARVGNTNRWDATLSLNGLYQGHPWELSLVGRNLFDELVPNFSNSTTLSGAAIQTTNIEETRSIALRASVSW